MLLRVVIDIKVFSDWFAGCVLVRMCSRSRSPMVVFLLHQCITFYNT